MGLPGSWVLTVLLVSLSQKCRLVSLFRPPSPAVLAPVDGLVFTGEVLTVQCTLQNLSYSIEETYLYISSSSSNLTLRVPPENTTIVDNKTMRGTFEILPEFPGNFTVSCMSAGILLKPVNVYNERPIRNITNFSAVYFYDMSRLESTWDLGESYLDTDRINLDIDWNPSQPPNLSGTKCDQESWESCAINVNGQDVIFIRVNITHKKAQARPNATFLVPQYGTNAVSVHMLYIKDITKVGRPMGLTVVNKSSSCVNIFWQNTGYFQPGKDAFYHATATDLGNNETRILAESGFKLSSERVVQLCGLRPYTSYELSLSLRAYILNTWSDPSFVHFWTEEAAPLSGPPVTDTSYSTSQCLNERRKVSLYWQDPTPQSLQGQITKFQVYRVGSQEPWYVRQGSNYFTLDDIPCNASTEFRIYTVNKIGESLAPSVMMVPQNEIAVSKDLKFRVEEFVEEDNRAFKNASIIWESSDLNENITMVVYFCQEAYVPTTCLNDYTVATAPVRVGKINLFNIPVSTYLFGFSLKDVNGEKRGINWTDCVYQANMLPSKPTGLKVNPGPSADSLSISWTPTPCSRSKKVLILGYQVSICKVATNQCQNVSIDDAYADNYIATGLEGNQPYRVILKAKSPLYWSPESESVEQTPFRPVPVFSGGDEKIGVVMGVLSAAILIGVLLVLVWRCFKRKNELKKEILPSDDSEQETDIITETFERTETNPENEDSGVGGSPLVSDSSPPELPVASAPTCSPDLVETTAAESGSQSPDDYFRVSHWGTQVAAQSRDGHASDSESICSGQSELALLQPNLESFLSGAPPGHNAVGRSPTPSSLRPRQPSASSFVPNIPTTLPTPQPQTVISHSPASHLVQTRPPEQVVFAIESSNLAPVLAQPPVTQSQPPLWQSSGSLAHIASSSGEQRRGYTDYGQQDRAQNKDTLNSATNSSLGYVQQGLVRNNDTLSSTTDSTSGYVPQDFPGNNDTGSPSLSLTTNSPLDYLPQGMVQNNDTLSSTTNSSLDYVQQGMVQNNDTLSSTGNSSLDYVTQGFPGNNDTGSQSLSLATDSSVDLKQQCLPDNNNMQLSTLNLASRSSDTSKLEYKFSKKGQERNNEIESKFSNPHVEQNESLRMSSKNSFLSDGHETLADTEGNDSSSSSSSGGSCSALTIDADSLIAKYNKSKTDQNRVGDTACSGGGFVAPGTGPVVEGEDEDSPAGDSITTTEASDIWGNGNTFGTSSEGLNHPWPQFDTDQQMGGNVAQAVSSPTLPPSARAAVPQPNSDYVSVNPGSFMPAFREPAEEDDQDSDSWSCYSQDGSTIC